MTTPPRQREKLPGQDRTYKRWSTPNTILHRVIIVLKYYNNKLKNPNKPMQPMQKRVCRPALRNYPVAICRIRRIIIIWKKTSMECWFYIGRGVEVHLCAREELVHLSAEEVVLLSKEAVVHLSAEVSAEEGEEISQGLWVSAGSGEDACGCVRRGAGLGPLITRLFWWVRRLRLPSSRPSSRGERKNRKIHLSSKFPSLQASQKWGIIRLPG